ncbi:MAG TPA: flagellar basal-body rod protein FlgF [Deltaproteobacteria bacterium]|nr:flagellar basal-body rod protein FlgF [Deltaproteobacteria bacterium]
MDRSIYVALSGASMLEKRLELIANNLANAATAGFKKQRPLFTVESPDAAGLRSFVTGLSVVNDMSQGPLVKTDNVLDLAIEGDGFFTVETPYGIRYTRQGSFRLDADGRLTTADGHPVLGDKGVIKLTTPGVNIDSAGNVEVDGVVVARLRIGRFDDPGALRKEGGLYSADGTGMEELKAGDGVRVLQGYQEKSNVNVVRQMVAMIEVSRSYETQSKVIEAMDDEARKAVNEVGRTS